MLTVMATAQGGFLLVFGSALEEPCWKNQVMSVYGGPDALLLIQSVSNQHDQDNLPAVIYSRQCEQQKPQLIGGFQFKG